MRDRPPTTTARPSTRRSTVSIDVVSLTPHGRRLTTLLVRAQDAKVKEKWELPWDSIRADETLEEVATRIARTTLGVAPTWVEQVGAFGDQRRHPGGADVSVGYIALVPDGTPAPIGGAASWFPVDDLPPLPPRQTEIIESALGAMRSRLDESPIAFRLLPSTFTLSQLQEIYEILLGRRLHKASFRRALHAAWLVEPTDEWRSEGRGRPAQLFRYAPKKRRGGRRGVRFEELAG